MKTSVSILVGLLLATSCISCHSSKENTGGFPVEKEIDYCRTQAALTLSALPSADKIPNSVDKGCSSWNYTGVGSWTCGFWPGILWYLYEDTRDSLWEKSARKVSDLILPFAYKKARSHDSGFIMMTSLGNGYRLTGDLSYKAGLLSAADSLAELYNPKVGTILSWPNMVKKEGWPHNTIIDNMMNLELLFWAARNGGDKRLYDMAVRHAETTMRHQFRSDYSCYHVAVYDTIDGHFIKGVTHQGLSDDSMWARGQAWAIYGYTMVYRETGDSRFLDFARKVSDVYLKRLPDDRIPYWDFTAREISPAEPRDASAAAITASALLELSTYVADADSSAYYKRQAIAMLEALSSSAYQAGTQNSAFLLHSVGHMNKNWEVDASISYADYYYLEALIRLKRLETGHSVLADL